MSYKITIGKGKSKQELDISQVDEGVYTYQDEQGTQWTLTTDEPERFMESDEPIQEDVDRK